MVLAVNNGALFFPYSWKDETVGKYADSKNARLASFKPQLSEIPLSPTSLVNIATKIKLVLPSPKVRHYHYSARANIH